MKMGGWHRGRTKRKKLWKVVFEDLYNKDTQEEGAVHMCGFDGIRRDNCFGGEKIGRAELR